MPAQVMHLALRQLAWRNFAEFARKKPSKRHVGEELHLWKNGSRADREELADVLECVGWDKDWVDSWFSLLVLLACEFAKAVFLANFV